MRQKIAALLLGTTVLSTSVFPTFSQDFSTPIYDCVVEVNQDCFEILFTEFAERALMLDDPQAVEDYTAVAAALLLQAEMPKRAEHLAKKINNPAHLDELHAHIGVAYTRKGMINDALRLLENIKETFSRAALITAIATGLSENAKFDISVAPLVALMPPQFVDTVFLEISRALVEEKRLKQANEAAQFIVDPLLQGHALGRTATTHAKAGEIAEAVSNLEQIRDPNFSVLAWGEAGFILHQAGFTRDSREFYDRAVAIIEKEVSKGVDQNAQLESIANYLIRSGHVHEAKPLVTSINKPVLRAFLFNQIGAHYARIGNDFQASKHLRHAVSIGMDDVNEAHLYNSIVRHAISQVAKIGDLKFALSTARSIEDANIRGGAIKSVGDVLWEAGDFGAAKEIYKSIDHLDIRSVAMIEMARALYAAGEHGKAGDILVQLEKDLAKKTVGLREGSEAAYLRGSSISNLSRAFADHKDISAAIRVASMIANLDQRLWTLVGLYGAAVDASENMLADQLHDQLLVEFRNYPRAGQLSSLVHFLATLPTNLELVERHQVYAGLLHDDMSRSLFYSAVFENLTLIGSYDAASEIHRLIPDVSIRDVATIELLKRRIQRIIEAM